MSNNSNYHRNNGIKDKNMQYTYIYVYNGTCESPKLMKKEYSKSAILYNIYNIVSSKKIFYSFVLFLMQIIFVTVDQIKLNVQNSKYFQNNDLLFISPSVPFFFFFQFHKPKLLILIAPS